VVAADVAGLPPRGAVPGAALPRALLAGDAGRGAADAGTDGCGGVDAGAGDEGAAFGASAEPVASGEMGAVAVAGMLTATGFTLWPG
jgi:hypothetical protein